MKHLFNLLFPLIVLSCNITPKKNVDPISVESKKIKLNLHDSTKPKETLHARAYHNVGVHMDTLHR
jgi:hypothetical protein